ncbi:MAG: T9SS type A sorting domain-containing protein, partial [Phaeodactylibacter sp.]|nr:T9SS type A sorting domain-containing protein [Phaeodactylibacter sp.]
STLNGDTWLNGEVVDPLSTANPLEFCILGQTFTQGAGWTDCTDTHWEGKLGEILFFEDALDEDAMIGLSEYLRRKWLRTADLESPRVRVDWQGTVAVETLPREEGLNLYPNPTDDHLIVETGPGFSNEPLHLQIFDLYGRLIRAEERAYAERLRLDLESLAPGIYQLAVRQGDQQWSGTFVRR